MYKFEIIRDDPVAPTEDLQELDLADPPTLSKEGNGNQCSLSYTKLDQFSPEL